MVGELIKVDLDVEYCYIGVLVLCICSFGCVLVVQLVSLVLYVGEVLGIVGLIGFGWIEFLCLIFGVDCVDQGEIFIGDSQQFVCICSFKDVVKVGIVMVIEDCKGQGLLLL